MFSWVYMCQNISNGLKLDGPQLKLDRSQNISVKVSKTSQTTVQCV